MLLQSVCSVERLSSVDSLIWRLPELSRTMVWRSRENSDAEEIKRYLKLFMTCNSGFSLVILSPKVMWSVIPSFVLYVTSSPTSCATILRYAETSSTLPNQRAWMSLFAYDASILFYRPSLSSVSPLLLFMWI